MTAQIPSSPASLAQYQIRIKDLIAQDRRDLALEVAQDVYAQEALAPIERRSVLLARVFESNDRRGDAIALLQGIELAASAQVFLAELLMRDGQKAAAVAALPDNAALTPLKGPAAARLLLARALVLLDGDCVDAAGVALQSAAQAATSDLPVSFWIALAVRAEKAGLPALIRTAAFSVARSDQTTLDQIHRALTLLLASLAGLPQVAIPEDVVAGIERHLAMPQAPVMLRLRFAQLLLYLGQQNRVHMLLAAAADGPVEESAAFFLLMRLQAQTGDDLSAAATARRAMQSGLLTGSHEIHAIEVLFQDHVKHGRNEAARALLEDAIERYGVKRFGMKWVLVLRRLGLGDAVDLAAETIRRAHLADLPATLAEGLAALPREPGPTFAKAPPAMQQTWRLSGRPDADWPDWSERISWGRSAAKLLQTWGYYAGDAGRGELLALIDPIDLSPISQAMQQGRGVILAGTHLGPVAASFFAFEELEWPFAYLGRGAAAAATKAKGILLVEAGQQGSTRQMLQHLQAGGLLGIAVDVAAGGKHRIVQINGVDVCVSRLAARLSYSETIPSVWYQAKWIGARLKVTLKTLPVARAGEHQADFEDRWFQSYEDLLCSYLQGGGENQTGFIPYTTEETPLDAWILDH